MRFLFASLAASIGVGHLVLALAFGLWGGVGLEPLPKNRYKHIHVRFSPAIHGLRDFPEALPASGASADFVRACSTASEQCVFVVVFLALSPLRLSFLHERHGALSAFRATDRSGELPGGSIQ